MSAKKPREVFVVECEGCGLVELATRTRGDAMRAQLGYPTCVHVHRDRSNRNVVTKYIEAPKRRRAKG